MDVDGLSIYHCSSQRATTGHQPNFRSPRDRERSVRCRKRKLVAIRPPNGSVARFTQKRRVFGDDVEHRLNIRRRTSDHAQNLTRRRLLLQSLFELLEESDILGGDDRLISKRLQQLDLRRGEGTHLEATPGQYSNEFPMLAKGSG
jgi:hypothetical protein